MKRIVSWEKEAHTSLLLYVKQNSNKPDCRKLRGTKSTKIKQKQNKNFNHMKNQKGHAKERPMSMNRREAQVLDLNTITGENNQR